ncbi:MAG: hypothetical protein K8T26_08785 [Lentisphaerae bacterium]|nr:hypothetical protein [Lentisphaerota bacterium]
MLTLPPWPSWDGLHPLVVHFPIALLMFAPVLVLAGLVCGKARGGLHLAALLLMGFGTLAAYLAVETGEAAAHLAPQTEAIRAAIEEHAELAETARLIFTLLTVVWLAFVTLSGVLRRRLGERAVAALPLLFLVGYAFGMLVLANAGHLGGRLVHELGVRSPLSVGAGAVSHPVADGDGD